MKSENILIKNNVNEVLMNYVKKNKVAIMSITAFLFAAIIYVMAFHEKAEERQDVMMAPSACVQTTGCGSFSCISHKQYRYNSSGLKQCCTC